MEGDDVFTPVVLCATAMHTGYADLELGPQGILLIRSSLLPAWAQSVYYDRNELHVSNDDIHVVLQLQALVRAGDALVIRSKARYLHSGAAIAAAMLGLDASAPPGATEA